MTEEIRKAIETANADELRALVSNDPSLGETDVRFGDHGRNAVPPLHYICDVAFRGLVTQAQALELADALLDAGVELERVYAKSGDTYLIAAASLGVENVGMRLVEQGVDVTPRGLFRATALHWAAYMGLDRLVRVLIESGAEAEALDERYDCTPLQWALYAWKAGGGGDRESLARAAARLVEGGARVPADAFDALTEAEDAPLRASLAARRER